MLYVFLGNDYRARQEKLNAFLEQLRAKKSEAELFLLDEQTFSSGKLEELASGQGLFDRNCIVVLSRTLESREALDVFLDKIELLGNSSNVFIVVEEAVDKSLRELFKKYAARVWNSDIGTRKTKPFNVFLIADALGKRDKKRAWIVFQNAMREGITPEQIHGTIFWHVKNMLLVKKIDNPSLLGMKPFVLKKTESAARHYREEELAKLSSLLVDTYHRARAGKGNLADGIEKILINL